MVQAAFNALGLSQNISSACDAEIRHVHLTT